MTEDERRVEAIRRVALGESVAAMCQDLQRTRAWYYKWRAVYATAGSAGLHDHRPGHAPAHQTPPALRHLILDIRDRLVKQAEDGASHVGIGDGQIQHELRALGVEPPHRATIYRILKAAGRVTPPELTRGDCPQPPVGGANAVHQLDLWPCVLAGGQTLFIIHLVDVASWYPCGRVLVEKSTDAIVDFLLASWQSLGVPRVLQVDNEMAFTGGRWAARLGRLVRLALLVGCEVWFNPFRHAPMQCLRRAVSRPV